MSKTSSKPGLLSKIIGLIPGTKSSPKRANKNMAALKSKPAPKAAARPAKDPAHAPGHKRINVKKSSSENGPNNRPQNDSARNQMARDSRIAQKESQQRRIIGKDT